MALKFHSQALEDVALALEYLKSSNLSEEKQLSKEKELKKVASLIERELKNFQSAEAVPVNDIKNVERLSLDNPNTRFPQLSEAVQIKYAAGRGRYAVAARDIKIGINKHFNSTFKSLNNHSFVQLILSSLCV